MLREAGGLIPDRNVERMLRDTHIPVQGNDNRRLDIIVAGLHVARGLPLFCDVTVVSPITTTGVARSGTSNRGGRLLEDAEASNNRTYREVTESGLGALYCLGSEVFGRWGAQAVNLIPALARERARDLHPRTKRGVALGLMHRWWGLLGLALQNAVAFAVLHEHGDLPELPLEAPPPIDELAVGCNLLLLLLSFPLFLPPIPIF